MKSQRAQNFNVLYRDIRSEFFRLVHLDPVWSATELKASDTYIRGFCRRFHLTYRTPTHMAQQCRTTPEEKCLTQLEYLNKLNHLSQAFDPECTVNFDETPIRTDHSHNRTIDEIGNRSIDICNTGHDKSRFTAVCSVTASGKALPVFIIFRNLKNVPKGPFPDDTVIAVNESGSMDQRLMIEYIDKILVPHFQGRRSLLIMDSYGSHCTDAVYKHLMSIRLEISIFKSK